MHRLIILLLLLVSFHLNALTNEEYENWWSDYRNNAGVPLELRDMEDYFINNEFLVYSSNFWNDFNRLNIEQLSMYGMSNFKQTVAGNYFTWKVSIDHPYAINLKKLVPVLNVTFSSEELNRKHSLWSQQESTNYNLITMYYLNYMLDQGWGNYIDVIEEPIVGNPPFNYYKGKRVSQDLFNSLLEYLSVVYHCPMNNISTIIEIGAGYGRTAFCFLTFHPEKKYIIVDFPPALYVAQTYLCDVFPDTKVFKFRPFDNFSEVQDEFSKANIVFLTPDQMSKLPNGSGDLFLAIDCLHEMKKARVDYYFNEADRLCTYFYYKCWKNTYVGPDDVNHTEYTYPNKAGWKNIFKVDCPIPSGFFHAMYKMK